MNTIDEAMIAILEKRLELSKLNYSDDTYDDVEEMLHDLEDDFNEKYGDQLEDILEKDIYAVNYFVKASCVLFLTQRFFMTALT